MKSRKQDNTGLHRWQPIHDWIIRQIESDAWADGARLPSVRALAGMFHTSIGTVQRALEELEASAWLRIVPKVGTFVTSHGRPPGSDADFSGITVQVDKAVVRMLSQAVQPGHVSFSSAVLADELVPQVQLNKCLAHVAKQADASLHGLAPPPGLPALRRRIASLMLERGVACSPDDILITSGDSVAMELALAAAAPPGARVAIETPTYYGILQVIERLGMKAVPIRTDPQSGICVDQLASAISQKRIDAIFINPTLHNPLGYIMPDQARQRLASLAEKHGIPVIEDDVFFDLAPGTEAKCQRTDATEPETRAPRGIVQRARNTPRNFHTIKKHLPDNTIYCASFSKTLTPGYRVGWCVPGRYRNEIMAQMFSRNLSVSSIAQAVLAEFLGRKYLAPHVESLQKRLAENSRFLHALVQKDFPPGTRHHPPRGGFIHWIELPDHIDMRRLISDANQLGCHISPSNIFYPDAPVTQTVRICLGCALTPDITRALRALGRCALTQNGA